VSVAPRRDLIVVGGGPAGLAVSIAAARRGLDVVVLERGAIPSDKACGEGILPAGVSALEELGVLGAIDPSACSRLGGIRWIDGPLAAEAALPAPGGLGVRRTALSAALLARAVAAGVEVRPHCSVTHHRRGTSEVEVLTAAGAERARLLVAADGLASPVRRREGLEVGGRGGARFGLRRHFARAPWSDRVEVHFIDGAEAYVTPVGPRRVGIALLCEDAARASYPALLARFPEVERRVASCPSDSANAGAGHIAPEAQVRNDNRILMGDAAGYVDAITGEGLSLAFVGALALARELPAALAAGARRDTFARWERGERWRFARYAATARTVLALARRPSARRALMALLGRHPRLFSGLVGALAG
jgi:flavin-dependent dehydrogenase